MTPLVLAAALALGQPAHPIDRWQLGVHETLVIHLDALLSCRPALPEHVVPAWIHLSVQVDAQGHVDHIDFAPQHAPPGPKLLRCLDRTVRALAFPPPPTPMTFVRTLFLEDGLPEEGRPGVQRIRLPLLVGGAPVSELVGRSLPAILELGDGPQRTATAFVLDADQVVPDLRRRLWLQRIWDQVEGPELDLRRCGALDTRLLLDVGADGALAEVTVRGAPPEVEACLVGALHVAAGPAPDGRATSLAVSVGFEGGGISRALWGDDAPVPLLSDEDGALVDAVRRRAQRGVGVCYSRALDEPRSSRPPVAGTLDVGLLIGSVGEVLAVHTGGELGLNSLASCVAAVLDRLEFPAPAEGGVIALSTVYSFSPE